MAMLAACGVLASVLRAQQVLYWDTNGRAAGSSEGETASGDWDNNAVWNTSSDGTNNTQAWATGATAAFSAGTNATGTSRVIMQRLRQVSGLTFNLGDVTVEGAKEIQESLVPYSGSLLIQVAAGATGRLNRIYFPGSRSPGLTKRGAGLLSMGTDRLTPDNFGPITLEEGATEMSGLPEVRPRLLWVGVDSTASLSLFGSSTNSINMAAPNANNVVLGLNAGGVGNVTVAGGSNLVFKGRILVGGAGTGTLNVNAGGIVKGGLANSGSGSDPAQIVLASSPGSFGTLNLNGGLLVLRGNNALVKGSGTAAFNFNGGSIVIRPNPPFGAVSSSVPMVLSGNCTLDLGTVTGSIFSGVMTGAGSLATIGPGSLRLEGTHSYTGDTAVRGGTLELVNASAALPATNSLSVGENSLAGHLVLSNGARVTPTTFTRIGSSNGTGYLTLTGTGTRVSTGSYLEVGSSGNGALGISSGASVTVNTTAVFGLLTGATGTLDVTGTGSALTTGSTLFVGYLGLGICTVGSGGVIAPGDLNLGLLPGGNGTFTVSAGGTLNIGGANGITAGAGSATLALAGGTLKVTGTSLTSSVPMTLSNASAVNTNGFNATLSGALSGAGGLIKTGSGTLTLNAPGTYTGGTTVAAGELVVPAANRLGTGGIALTGGTLSSTASFSRDSTVVVGGPVSALSAATFLEFGASGTGALSISGGGRVSAPASIALGVLETAQASADVSGPGSALNTEGTLFVGYFGVGGVMVGAGGSVTVGTKLLLGFESSGSGSFSLNAGGTLNLGGPDGLAKGEGTAAFNFNGGVLKVTGASLSSSVPMTLTGSSIVDTNGLDATFSGALTGAGDLTKTGAGVLAITSANTLTGSTGILAGTLGVASPASLGTRTLFLNGGTLDLSFNGTATVQSLQFDNVPQASGLWGGLSSTAIHKTARITGPGLLNVLSSIPPPSFNPATGTGLSCAISNGVINLAAVTGATPSGGTFGGPGVSGAGFDPAAAGYGLHTLTYTASGLSSTFTIAVTGGLTLDEEGGTFAANNLAPGGTAFAKEVFLGYGSYTIPHLNDGAYGSPFSWIGTTANTYAGVHFANAAAVSRIAFSRDNTGAFTDRAGDFYIVQYSTAADPAQPSATWISLGAVDYRTGGSAGIGQPARRHVFSFPAVTATGLRIVCATPGTAIDEIEIYPASGLFATSGLTLLQEGGVTAPDNLATGCSAFAKDVFPHPSHSAAHLNDSTYGNSFSWLGTSANSFVGLNPGGSVTLDRIAFGRDNTGLQSDRATGRYTLQYTTVVAPDATTPDASWITLGLLDYQSSGGPLFSAPARRHLYGFPAVTATGIRLIAPTGAVIDELELYRAAPHLKLEQPDTTVVANGGTVPFGALYPATPAQKTFTITNSGTSTLTLGALGLEGTVEGDFTASAISVSTLEPGESTTFIIAYNVGAAGPHSATVLLPSNGSSGSVASFTITGTSLVPAFNSATTAGLIHDRTAGALDLATATGAVPAGGVFSGAGVSAGSFDPVAAGYGIHTLTYSAGGSSSPFTVSVVGGLTLLTEGGDFLTNNLAPDGTAFALDSFLESGPHSIAHLNDAAHGNDNSWIGISDGTFAGLNLGATPVAVNRIAFGRDNEGTFADRAVDHYTLQYTTAPNPDASTTAWTSIGAVDYRSPSIVNPGLRHLFSFPTFNATGLRIITATAGTAIDEIEIYSPFTPQELWRQQHFGSTANAGNAADDFDFDSDGLTNLVEYAFGQNPTRPGTEPGDLQSVLVSGNLLQLQLTRRPDRNDITLTAQASDDLNTWTDLAKSTAGQPFAVVAIGTLITETGTGNTRAVTVTEPAPGPRRYLRVLAAPAP